MRVSSLPPSAVSPQRLSSAQANVSAQAQTAPQGLTFAPFGADAFAQARARHVPVFLIIADTPDLPADPSLLLHLSERTVPVFLRPGERPDV